MSDSEVKRLKALLDVCKHEIDKKDKKIIHLNKIVEDKYKYENIDAYEKAYYRTGKTTIFNSMVFKAARELEE